MGLTGGAARRSVTLLGRGMRAHPRTYLAAMTVSAAFGGLTVAVSRALGWATDAVVLPALAGDAVARGSVWRAGAVLLAVAVALGLAVAGRRIFAGLGYADLQADHRRAVSGAFLRLPMSWHRAHPTGQLLATASSDVEAATGVFNPLPFALGTVVMLVVATVSLLAADGWLAVAALTVIPVMMVANLVFQRRMSPAVTRAQQLRGEVADIAHESFEAAVLVKAMGVADREEARFAARVAELRDANVRVGVIRAVFDPVIDLLPHLGTLAVLVVGSVRLRAGAVGTGDVVGAAYLMALLAVPVRSFGWVFGDLPRALVGYDRIARVVDARDELAAGEERLPDVAGGPAGAGATGGGATVRLRGVGVRVGHGVGATDLLHGVDLDVPAGAVVAVVGPTGAGKSTLVSLLARLRDPSDGTVEVDGVDVRALRRGELPRRVALVGQQAFVFADTVRGNVTLADPGDGPDDAAVWQALRTAHLDAAVRRLPDGLDTVLGEHGANLSGGQRQRLALARAVVRRPRLLVLDDATSAVDPQVEQAILAGLRAEAPTVVIVAHRLASILLADRVVHLAGGRLVDVGTHAELLARDPGYVELVTAYEREAARRAGAADGAAGDETSADGRAGAGTETRG